MLRPMILLTKSVAILGVHTRLTRLETGTPLHAAIGTGDVNLIHPTDNY